MNESRELMPCEKLTDAELVRETKFLADRSRHGEVQLLEHLAEFDARRLCIEEGHRSLYEYCTAALGFEEGEAYRRIRVARVIRGFPEALEALKAKRVTSSSLVVLSPWLERKNVSEWLALAAGKSRRELEALVAARYPQAPQPDAVRNIPFHPLVVPAGAPPMAIEAAASAAVPDIAWQQMAPISAERVRVGFDAAVAISHLLERVKQLLRHKYPEGRLEDLIREVLDSYLDRKDPQRRLERKLAEGGAVAENSARPESRFPRDWAVGRYIPAKVKSEVWARDGGACSWRDKEGKICGAKDWLEYDHIHPYASGGRSDDPRNIRLLCRQHNQAAALAAGFSGGPASGG